MQQMSQSGPSAVWHAALAEGRILIQRDGATGRLLFPPRPTGAEAAEWVEASGRGTIHSLTTIPGRPPAGDRHVVLVDLEEGVRMMGVLDLPDAATTPAIGTAVVAAIAGDEGAPRVTFRPA